MELYAFSIRISQKFHHYLPTLNMIGCLKLYFLFQIKMPFCIVLGCHSGKQSLDATIPLPRSPGIKHMWLDKINRLDYKYKDKARICNIHFCEEDFTDYKTETRGKQNVKRKLKPTAVPSLYLSNDPVNYSIGSNGLSSVNQEEKNSKINSDAESICSKIQGKLQQKSEKSNSESNLALNPWDVTNASVFLSYCCPECDFKSGDLLGFSQHAIINHVLSNTLFNGRNSLKVCDMENGKNPEVNSNETKLGLGECTDDSLSDKTPKSYELDIDPSIEHEETMESEPKIELNGSHGANLENQFDTCGVKVQRIGSFVCESCDFKTNTFSLLNQHVNWMHKRSFQCSYCESNFPFKKQLEYHIEANHPGTSELKYFCSECGDGFMYEKNMERHLRKHKKPDKSVIEEKKTQKCSICSKRYEKNINLLKHIDRVHEIPRASLHRYVETVNETQSMAKHLKKHKKNEKNTKSEGKPPKLDDLENGSCSCEVSSRRVQK